MLESTVVGKICHIKAAKPGGPRFDPQQTAAARHGYDNLVLLCGKHHTVIDDDDDETYTVERLTKMKADHESRAPRVDDDFAERAMQLLITSTVTSTNQSGGITAHTINQTVNLLSPAVLAKPRDSWQLQPTAGHASSFIGDHCCPE